MNRFFSKLAGLLRTALGIELLEYENKNHLHGDNASRSKEKLRLLQEALAISTAEEKRDCEWLSAPTPYMLDIMRSMQEVRLSNRDMGIPANFGPGVTFHVPPGPPLGSMPSTPLADCARLIEVKQLRHERDMAIEAAERWKQIAENLAMDALKALSSARIATPEKGYIAEPQCLLSDIRRLAVERDAAQEELQRMRECHAALHDAAELGYITINGKLFRMVTPDATATEEAQP